MNAHHHIALIAFALVSGNAIAGGEHHDWPGKQPQHTTSVVVAPNAVAGAKALAGASAKSESGPAKTVSGDITQNVGANAEGNNLKTGDLTVRDSGNAKLQSDIKVDGAKQTQEAKAVNQGVTGNSVTIDQRAPRQGVVAYAPPVYQVGGCPGRSLSGGVAGFFSAGGAELDRECQINQAETTVLQQNQQAAYGPRLAARFAVRMRCKSELVGMTKEECAALESEVMAQYDEAARQSLERARAAAEARIENDRRTMEATEAEKARLAEIASKLANEKAAADERAKAAEAQVRAWEEKDAARRAYNAAHPRKPCVDRCTEAAKK